MWAHVKYLKHNISSSPKSMVPMIGRVVTESERAPPIKPYNHRIGWSHGKFKTQKWKLWQIAALIFASYIAIKSRSFFYEKSLCFPDALFIFSKRNNKIPLKLSTNAWTFIHTQKEIRSVEKRNFKLDTNHCSSTSSIYGKVWFSTIVHHEKTSIFAF